MQRLSELRQRFGPIDTAAPRKPASQPLAGTVPSSAEVLARGRVGQRTALTQEASRSAPQLLSRPMRAVVLSPVSPRSGKRASPSDAARSDGAPGPDSKCADPSPATAPASNPEDARYPSFDDLFIDDDVSGLRKAFEVYAASIDATRRRELAFVRSWWLIRDAKPASADRLAQLDLLCNSYFAKGAQLEQTTIPETGRIAIRSALARALDVEGSPTRSRDQGQYLADLERNIEAAYLHVNAKELLLQNSYERFKAWHRANELASRD